MAITALPPAPSTADPTNFATKADALLGALAAFVTQANALEVNVNAKELLATAAGVLAQAALNAGLANAAANAIAAAAARVAAEAAWTAALAANPDLNPSVRMNPHTIAADVTVPSGYNAYSAGPLTIGEGVNVTLADNSQWSVL